MDDHDCDRCRWLPWEGYVWACTAVVAVVLVFVTLGNLTDPGDDSGSTTTTVHVTK